MEARQRSDDGTCSRPVIKENIKNKKSSRTKAGNEFGRFAVRSRVEPPARRRPPNCAEPERIFLILQLPDIYQVSVVYFSLMRFFSRPLNTANQRGEAGVCSVTPTPSPQIMLLSTHSQVVVTHL